MAVAFRACLERYYHLHPTHRYLGFAPDYTFIADYIATALDKELDSRALEELATSVASTSEPVGARIRELKRKLDEHEEQLIQQFNIAPPEQL
jgi:phosphosulfolactate phosphohydrolase-like enzyme